MALQDVINGLTEKYQSFREERAAIAAEFARESDGSGMSEIALAQYMKASRWSTVPEDKAELLNSAASIANELGRESLAQRLYGKIGKIFIKRSIL